MSSRKKNLKKDFLVMLIGVPGHSINFKTLLTILKLFKAIYVHINVPKNDNIVLLFFYCKN